MSKIFDVKDIYEKGVRVFYILKYDTFNKMH